MILLSDQDWVLQPGKFIALWTDAAYAYALYQPQHLVAVALHEGTYPALPHAGAAWYQRLAQDLHSHIALGATDTRPAIAQHRNADFSAAWPDFSIAPGEGVHQLAVGPIHAGIIEPGHFRFSVRGEQVLRLEARLGYAHRGVLALMRGKSPRLAARFAARISGDATVAHSLAFAQAAEAALGLTPPPRAIWLRGIMAELERLANHTADIGAIAGDAGFAFLDARFALARELTCAAAATAFGHRLMMDMVVPGGIAGDMSADGASPILAALAKIEAELPGLRRVFEDYASLQDRVIGTGIIPPALAEAFAAGGYVGRASAQAQDARLIPGYPPYLDLAFDLPVQHEGDVAARIRVRLDEIMESIRLVRAMLDNLPAGPLAIPLPPGSGMGLGVAESFRGPVWHWLNIDNGAIIAAFAADASALHWPLLEYAATTGILADFPLINKSINGSYAGVDL